VKELTLRQYAVLQGRAMIRVRHSLTRENATIGVCPACWNIPSRRKTLLFKLGKISYEPALKDDLEGGAYRQGKSHAPGCPYGKMEPDAWTRLKGKIKELKKRQESE